MRRHEARARWQAPLGWYPDRHVEADPMSDQCPLVVRLACPLTLSPFSSGWRNSAASVGMPLAICCSSSQRLMQRSTSTHLRVAATQAARKRSG